MQNRRPILGPLVQNQRPVSFLAPNGLPFLVHIATKSKTLNPGEGFIRGVGFKRWRVTKASFPPNLSLSYSLPKA